MGGRRRHEQSPLSGTEGQKTSLGFSHFLAFLTPVNLMKFALLPSKLHSLVFWASYLAQKITNTHGYSLINPVQSTDGFYFWTFPTHSIAPLWQEEVTVTGIHKDIHISL